MLNRQTVLNTAKINVEITKKCLSFLKSIKNIGLKKQYIFPAKPHKMLSSDLEMCIYLIGDNIPSVKSSCCEI